MGKKYRVFENIQPILNFFADLEEFGYSAQKIPEILALLQR